MSSFPPGRSSSNPSPPSPFHRNCSKLRKSNDSRPKGILLELLAEVLDPLHVVVLGLRCEFANRHVFNHAPAQRADGLFGHGGAPVLSEVGNTSISGQDASARYRCG